MVPRTIGIRLGLVAAAACFVAYPALRPYGPETGAAGAADLASTAWLAAHALGMAGFVLLAFALRAAVRVQPWPWRGRPLRETESRAWLAVVLLLPYYGAEAYGLQAVGRYAAEHADPGVLEVADAFRYAPLAMTAFALGLLLLVLVGGRLAHGLWGSGAVGRAGGLLAGLGLPSYLPQFFAPGPVRLAHGVVLGIGLLLAAHAVQERSQIVESDDVSAAAAASETGSSVSVTT